MSIDLSAYDNTGDDNNKPSPMLGLKPFLAAAEKMERSVNVIKDTQTKTNTALGNIDKTLNKLIGVLSKISPASGGKMATSQNGGGGTFSGQPHNPGGQPRQNGGGGTFSGFKYNPQPSIYAPTGFSGGVARAVAAFGGNTPKQWGTRYAGLETGVAVVQHTGQQIAKRGMDQMADQYLLEQSFLRSQQRGATEASLDNGFGLMGIMGTRRKTANTFEETQKIGQTAYSGGLSTADDVTANDLIERFSGALGTENGKLRYKSLLTSAAGLTYANPGMSLTTASQITTNIIKPSNRLKMAMLGLPDPTNSRGQYKGNAAFFAAFLKRMYQKEAVPTNVFDNDFAETGIGWANLVNVVGEEGAQAMLEPLRAYNRAKATGQDTSDFDQVFHDAQLSGKEFDASRQKLAQKYGIKDNSVMLKQRQNAISRASEMSGNSEYLSAERTSSEAMFTFAEAVHAFVNAPLIGDIANFLKGAMPGAMQIASAGNQGAISVAGAIPLTGQGPEDRDDGRAPVTPSGKKKKDEIGGDAIAKKAASYANSSRKYKYSMPNRLKAGYFDCSSFVSTVYAQFGYTIGPTTVQMWRQGEHVDFDDLQPGDILLHADGRPGAQSGGREHTAMYIGNGKIVGTSSKNKNDTIQIQPLYGIKNGYWDDARRIVGAVKPGKSKSVANPGTDTGSSSNTGSDTSSSTSPGNNNNSSSTNTGTTTAGGGSLIGGLGAGNAAAYSTDELSVLQGILSGRAGGGSLGIVAGADTGSETDAEPPEDAKGVVQSPGDDPSAPKKKNTNGLDMSDLTDPRVLKILDPEGDGFTLDEIEKAKKGSKKSKSSVGNGGNPAANKALARSMLSQYGWGQGEWPPLDKLWTRESGWNSKAVNKRSGAAGIPQRNPEAHGPTPDGFLDNPRQQIKWGLNYIRGRYKTPTRAWAHSEAVGWYDVGTWQVPDDQVAMVHKDEMILPARQAQTIRDALISKNVGYGDSPERAKTPDTGSGSVTIHFQSGSIQLNIGQGANERQGRAAAQGFVKELEKHELWKDIAKGGGRVVRARA